MEKKKDINLILDKDILDILEKMDNKSAYDFFMGVLRYGLKGIVPDFKDTPLDLIFVPIKNKIDRNIEEYKKKCEKNAANARKRWDTNVCDGIQSDAMDANNNSNCNNNINNKNNNNNNLINKTKNNNNLNSSKENNSQYINTQLPKESLEVVFRNELKKNDNRKWITDSPTFEISLYNNKEFRDWVSSTNCDNEELRKIWDKFRVNYLSRVAETKEVEIPNIEIEDNSKDEETKKGNAPVEEVIDVSEGTNKEIYDYLKENKSQGLFKGSFYVACCHNSRGLGDWMYENGYDKEIVEKIFNQIDREAQVSR